MKKRKFKLDLRKEKISNFNSSNVKGGLLGSDCEGTCTCECSDDCTDNSCIWKKSYCIACHAD